MGRRVLVEDFEIHYHHLVVPRACARGHDVCTGEALDVWLDEVTAERVCALAGSPEARGPIVLDDLPEEWCSPAQ